MTPGIFARTYASKNPATLFAHVRRDGFTTVQFNLSCVGLDPLPAQLPPGIGKTVLAGAQANSVTLCALSGAYNMIHPDAAHRKADRAGFANVVLAAHEMGVSLVTLCTGTRDMSNMWRAHPDNVTSGAWMDLRAELDYALRIAEEADLSLAIEPEPGNVIVNAPLARRLLNEVGARRLGVILDAANLLPPEAHRRQADIVAQATELLGGDLFLVHVKDVDALGKVVPAGKGAVDLPAFVARVLSTGYDGPLIGHGFEEVDAPVVAAYLSSLIAGAAR
jgi:sugar phosphate isomerase/epimerase